MMSATLTLLMEAASAMVVMMARMTAMRMAMATMRTMVVLIQHQKHFLTFLLLQL